ncbi:MULTISPECIES: hypothetical protein [Agrobacterium]|jgi:hypothetical protein|uniref:Uncharacterized protein n=1 Tax=Agrobacterium fabrum TaxID=1176649 RepID=A0A3G2CQD2_9HYPH|nr:MULTISPECIES: hypothetical protein [Agrobacterium]AYM57526.1 hypothetical protein At1D132_15090 [Agrobacterium fabrum]AYM62580.1 hypothetical protein At12D13_14150 [Agrobacterium fabrum]EGL63558.1 hypothetical protein AGRO_3627 [Agrobacterium sp. ATCC 31749]KEY50581.1 hypothetical protein EN41_10495 [Agrobacterium tumefaciens]KJX88345.1 hypothetical protein SY94_1686 [Agrobacterium tumefaciens]
MKGFRDSVLFPLTLLTGGVVAFFLFLYVTGHDPDERPLTLVEWVIGGMLIGPGFGYLVKWRKMKNNRDANAD